MNKKLLALLFAVAFAPMANAMVKEGTGAEEETKKTDKVTTSAVDQATEKNKDSSWGIIDKLHGVGRWFIGRELDKEGKVVGSWLPKKLLYTAPATLLGGVMLYLAAKGCKMEGGYKKILDVAKRCLTVSGLSEAWKTDKDIVIAIYGGLFMMAIMGSNYGYSLVFGEKKTETGAMQSGPESQPVVTKQHDKSRGVLI